MQFHSDQLIERFEQWSKDSVVVQAMSEIGKIDTIIPPGAAGRWLTEWFDAVNKKNAGGVMGGVWRLARAGKMREAFADSWRYKEYWSKHLPQRFVDRREEFEKDPAAPAGLSPSPA